MNRLSMIAGTVTAGVAILGGWAWAGIEGSKHDFTRKEWTGGDACSACHPPASDTPPKAAPLWAQHADLNRTFGTSLVKSNEAGPGTAMCLRCHDGAIARDMFAPPPRPRYPNSERAGVFGPGHGRSDHPVGVEYPQLDLSFHPANQVIAAGTVTLPNGRVECISCHDPHNMTKEKNMLVTSNARSALCLTCHRK